MPSGYIKRDHSDLINIQAFCFIFLFSFLQIYETSVSLKHKGQHTQVNKPPKEDFFRSFGGVLLVFRGVDCDVFILFSVFAEP